MTIIGPDTLFKRSWRVTVGDKEFSSVDVQRPLSISFSVQRDKTLTPNNANVLLYNLSEDTRNELEELSGGFGQGTGKSARHTTRSVAAKKVSARGRKAGTKKAVAYAPQDGGVTVRIEAGYGENPGQIFFGVLRKVSSWKQGPDWLTQISGGDAERSITTARISRTFVAGTPLTAVVEALVGTLSVGRGGLANTLTALDVSGFLAGGRTLSKALTMHGDSATELEQFMRSLGFEWHIADGSFYAGPAGTPTFPGEGPLLTQNTGLLDLPQIDKNGKVMGKCLLNPDLLPGRVFRVESSRFTGSLLCEKTQHVGDTNGGNWEVQWIGGVPAKGSKAAELAKARGDTGF